MNELFTSLWEIILKMSPYLLLGFGVAGLLYAFVPAATYNKYLSHRGFGSVLNSTLLGIPLPLCSCGVLPTTISLRRNGASRGACTSFLISTPQTGVDSILATYSLLGLPFAIIRPLAALVTGVLGGVATDVAFDSDADEENKNSKYVQNEHIGLMEKLRKAFNYGYGELLQDVGRWLVLGLLVAAFITVVVPEDFFSILQQYPLLNMVLVLVIAVPMYVCATGSIPIALSLMLKGMSPGAAFVLLMAGPAINVASILVINRTFGQKHTMIYLLSIVLGAIGFGLIIDYLLPTNWFLLNNMSHADSCHIDSSGIGYIISILSSIIFVSLLIRAMILRYFNRNTPNSEHQHTLDLKVNGMRCSHCVANVKEALMSIAGIEAVDIDLKSGNVSIKGSQDYSIDRQLIIKEIEKAGYSVEK